MTELISGMYTIIPGFEGIDGIHVHQATTRLSSMLGGLQSTDNFRDLVEVRNAFDHYRDTPAGNGLWLARQRNWFHLWVMSFLPV